MGFLYAAAECAGLMDPKKPDTFPGCYAAFWADAIGTFVGGLFGTSSVTTYGESMAGVYEGGRTGVTALVIAFLNFLSMFFAPFFSSIPTLSTGPALIMVGVFMIQGVKDIDWMDYMQAIPSLLCILLQPVTYKIEVGICAGACPLMRLACLLPYQTYAHNGRGIRRHLLLDLHDGLLAALHALVPRHLEGYA